MALDAKQIEGSVNAMDEIYDANFGEWIRNENNCKVVGSNLKKYIRRYKTSEFIIVTKWIIKDWTLRSIILFSKKLVVDDLLSAGEEDYLHKIQILSGFMYTWNPIFISEFLMATSVEFPLEKKADYYVDVLSSFEEKKLSEILAQIEMKCDAGLKDLIVSRVMDGVYRPGKCRWKRTESLTNAFMI